MSKFLTFLELGTPAAFVFLLGWLAATYLGSWVALACLGTSVIAGWLRYQELTAERRVMRP